LSEFVVLEKRCVACKISVNNSGRLLSVLRQLQK